MSALPADALPAIIVPTSAEVSADPSSWFPRWRERWLSWGVAPAWCDVLAGLGPQLGRVGDELAARLAAGERILPAPQHVFRALSIPPEDVRVLIIGQDPYPTEGHPIGLAFACDASVRPLPRSLVNIYRELADDVGLAPAAHGDLSRWLAQGVMLLNSSLTVTRGEAGSHSRCGWHEVTGAIVSELGRRGARRQGSGQHGPGRYGSGHYGSGQQTQGQYGAGAPVCILWGRHAQSFDPMLQEHPVIKSAHPSPLSARRGFFGSRPFSRANQALVSMGYDPIDWTV